MDNVKTELAVITETTKSNFTNLDLQGLGRKLGEKEASKLCIDALEKNQFFRQRQKPYWQMPRL